LKSSAKNGEDMNKIQKNDCRESKTMLFNHLTIGYVVMTIVIATVAGMAGHELVTRFLQKPPFAWNWNLEQDFFLFMLLMYSIKTLATIFLYALIDQHWRLENFLARTFAFALLLAVINENFLRRFLMEIIADHRNPAWEFLLVAVPSWFSYIVVAATICLLFSFQTRSLWKYPFAFILVLLEYQYLETAIYSILKTFIHLNPGGNYTQGSYETGIIIASYLTYLLPVTGMFITWLLTRKSFPTGFGIKGILFFLLLVGVHGQLLGVLQIATSEGNILYRILYFGSFWWELLIVAYTIVFFVERKLAI